MNCVVAILMEMYDGWEGMLIGICFGWECALVGMYAG